MRNAHGGTIRPYNQNYFNQFTKRDVKQFGAYGNRPLDICALCDRVIDFTEDVADYHLYLGPGWVHGGGRESIPTHISCCSITSYREDSVAYANLSDRIKSHYTS